MSRIILVESDPQRNSLLTALLQGQGHAVSITDTLDQIPAVITKSQLDILVVDMDEHSLDEIVQIAPNLKDVKILFLGGNDDMQHDFRSWIADDIIQKSQDDDAINYCIQKILNRNEIH
jgi:DNA-binding response OmpR family regulator